jgi:glucose 1-dehydrogenase
MKEGQEKMSSDAVIPSCPPRKVLTAQKALVTGANSGIGEAIAVALGEAGADVVVNYLNGEERANEVVEEIRKTGTRDAPFDEMTLHEWNTVISVNLTGQFLCAREAVREFKRRGVVPNVSCSAGKIICISSVHEVIPWAGHANCAASKGAVMLMMKSLAQEVAPCRIRVNSIAPGAIRTPINRAAWDTEQSYGELMKLVPYKRIGEPHDVARAAVWLASDCADYVNGTSLLVDGGMTLYPGFAEGG